MPTRTSTAVKKSTVKKSTVKKPAVKKSTVKKSTVKKSTVKKTVKRIVKPTTRVAYVIDASDSMSSIVDETIKVFNEQFDIVSELEQEHNLPTSIVQFNGIVLVDKCQTNMAPQDINRLNKTNYVPANGTRIFPAIDYAIDQLLKYGKKGDSFLINVFTDGQDGGNKFESDKTCKRMQALIDTGFWTITFRVPRDDKASFIKSYNVEPGNVMEWEVSSEGTEDLSKSTGNATRGYFKDRSLGVTQSTSFYANVDTKKIKKVLDDVSTDFKILKVADNVISIKDFMEAKTKSEYITGSAYYQLMKQETVQGVKNVLIKSRLTGVVYGGPEARELVGLPFDGVTNVKLKPGNTGEYDIYIQSTSPNRNLYRGTEVLFDKNKVTSSRGTWGI